jgi:hypothetical protein
MGPEIMLQQKFPGRIGRPGSLVLRQLGEVNRNNQVLENCSGLNIFSNQSKISTLILVGCSLWLLFPHPLLATIGDRVAACLPILIESFD